MKLAIAPPAFTGGRGLKPAQQGGRGQARRGTARLHRRARIETQLGADGRANDAAPPAFTGGRGLKPEWLEDARVIVEHRPPSPAGAD
ncbi:hypothetical protein [Roseateles sp.]|uniref:hypothetical protein n=1 Tax=Roseateles sp. TaxID=1971397 RepID=UPI00396487B0